MNVTDVCLHQTWLMPFSSLSYSKRYLRHMGFSHSLKGGVLVLLENEWNCLNSR